jgi:hypothetical protein
MADGAGNKDALSVLASLLRRIAGRPLVVLGAGSALRRDQLHLPRARLVQHVLDALESATLEVF